MKKGWQDFQRTMLQVYQRRSRERAVFLASRRRKYSRGDEKYTEQRTARLGGSHSHENRLESITFFFSFATFIVFSIPKTFRMQFFDSYKIRHSYFCFIGRCILFDYYVTIVGSALLTPSLSLLFLVSFLPMLIPLHYLLDFNNSYLKYYPPISQSPLKHGQW